jgi:uncharacterized protein with PQ loop repeat
MTPCPTPVAAPPPASQSRLRRLLGLMSIFTLAMTLPQVWTIWVERQAAGVSVLSWGAYLLSALLWFVYGLQQRDKNIWLPCIGWIVLNAAVVLGAWRHG